MIYHIFRFSNLCSLHFLFASFYFTFKERIIIDNLSDIVKGFFKAEVERPYLTLSEVQKLANAECRIPVIKRAFLFAYLTGLRYSDLEKLKWKVLRENEDELRIIFNQKKTDGLEYLYISQNAEELMGAKGDPDIKKLERQKPTRRS